MTLKLSYLILIVIIKIKILFLQNNGIFMHKKYVSFQKLVMLTLHIKNIK